MPVKARHEAARKVVVDAPRRSEHTLHATVQQRHWHCRERRVGGTRVAGAQRHQERAWPAQRVEHVGHMHVALVVDETIVVEIVEKMQRCLVRMDRIIRGVALKADVLRIDVQKVSRRHLPVRRNDVCARSQCDTSVSLDLKKREFRSANALGCGAQLVVDKNNCEETKNDVNNQQANNANNNEKTNRLAVVDPRDRSSQR